MSYHLFEGYKWEAQSYFNIMSHHNDFSFFKKTTQVYIYGKCSGHLPTKHKTLSGQYLKKKYTGLQSAVRYG